MTTFFSAARSFWNDEQGVTAIEYGLIAALISVAIITGIGLVTTGLTTVFTRIETALTTLK